MRLTPNVSVFGRLFAWLIMVTATAFMVVEIYYIGIADERWWHWLGLAGYICQLFFGLCIHLTFYALERERQKLKELLNKVLADEIKAAPIPIIKNFGQSL